MKDSLLFITEKPTDSLSSGMDKRPILITLLITLLGSWLPSLFFNGFQTLENAGSVRIPYAPPI